VSKVVITGQSGSIGTQLASTFLEKGIEVVSIPLGNRVQNKNYFDSIPNPESIDTLYHLAANSFVPKSWENPAEFIETNVLGTTQALEFCRENKIEFIYVSSYAYGIPQYLPIDEKHPVSTVNPYGLSKIMAEQLCSFYGENYDVKYTIVRPFNIYGSLKNKALLIPEIIEQIITGIKISVKDLTPKRDYLYLQDFVDFLIKIKGNSTNEIYNAGSGKSYSVSDIIAICQRVWETEIPVESEKVVRKNEIPETICDITKAKEKFQWKPTYSFEDGIRAMKKSIQENQE